eukprot:UN16809
MQITDNLLNSLKKKLAGVINFLTRAKEVKKLVLYYNGHSVIDETRGCNNTVITPQGEEYNLKQLYLIGSLKHLDKILIWEGNLKGSIRKSFKPISSENNQYLLIYNKAGNRTKGP